jgi:hypothetical protein
MPTERFENPHAKQEIPANQPYQGELGHMKVLKAALSLVIIRLTASMLPLTANKAISFELDDDRCSES